MINSIKKTPGIASIAAVIGTLGFTSLSALPSQAALLVGNTEGNNILLFDEQKGEFLGEFIAPGSGGLLSPDDLNFGPDGNLYVTSGTTPETSAILRYDGMTGEFIDVFAAGNGLFRPYGAAFGPDGLFYVASFLSDKILRFDDMGAFVDVFASGNGLPGGLNGPDDLLFAPDGSLYVTTQGSIATNGQADFSAGLPSQVLRFDIATKTSMVFAEPTPSPDSFGFVSLLGLALGFEGDLFVSDFANDIRRYNLETGNLVSVLPTNYTGTILSNNFIGNLTFDPNNILYAVGFDFSTDDNFGAILRYDGITGEPLPSVGNSSAVFVSTNDKLLRPIGIAFTAQIPLKSVPEPVSVFSLLAVGIWGIQTKLRR